ncbi:MAG: DUF1570 domain-containing protein [Phycisphaerae bacterium]|jgi:hypothetical protein
MRPSVLLAAMATLVSVQLGTPSAQAQLRTYETKYYSLHTDTDTERAQELVSRLTLMAEEYHNRTSGFSRTIRDRLPVYVFRDVSNYYAHGGMPNTAGVFMGDRLMVLAGEELTERTWHVLQHEGFHQFADAAIGDDLPIWANEGMAEYFGHGIYTGDGFYTGLIPPDRLIRIKSGINRKHFRPLLDMMRLPHAAWNVEVMMGDALANYDQAWAMVHFLAHADNGRYQEPFGRFLKEVSRGQNWEAAWARIFGNSVDAFQQRWEEYWLSLDENPTADLYAETTVAALTSFYARAFSQRQFFDTFEEFAAAAEAGELRHHADDWLPSALLTQALKDAPSRGTWTVEKKPGRRLVICELPNGRRVEGSYKIANKRVKSIDVNIRKAKRRK